MKNSVSQKYGKKVSIDEVTGKINLANSLGLNNPFKDKSILEQEMNDIRTHYSPEEIEKKKKLEQEREIKITTAFNEWIKVKHEDEYVGHIPVNPNHLIIKVFYYHELTDMKVSDGGIILTESNEMNLGSLHRVLPIGYVVSSNSEDVKTGDLVNLPSLISKTKISEEYKQWMKDVREQPTLKREELFKPPMYIGILSQWGQYIYQKNPFSDVNIEDQHTFCVPDRIIQSIRKDLK